MTGVGIHMAQAIAAVVAAFWHWRAATVVEERRRIARNLQGVEVEVVL